MARSADEVTAELVEWAGAVLPGVPVGAPSIISPLRQSGVDLRLVRATPGPAPQSASAPLTIDLDYLITVQLADAPAEHEAITELMFAAMARHDVEVLGGYEVARVCQAVGLPMAQGMVLRVPLARERQPKRGDRPRLLQQPAKRAAPGAIDGLIVGPQDEPVDGAMVEAVGLDGAVLSDGSGRFRIAAAGPEGAAVRLIVRARGAEFGAVAVAGLPVTLRLPQEA